MSDNIEFETESYGGMEGAEAVAEQESTAETSFLSGAPCSNSECENTSNPAEEAWVKLVSAIPVAGQVQNLKCVAQGTAAPSTEEVQSLVSQIRPDDPDKYALETIANFWADFRLKFAVNEDTAVAPILRSKLTELSNGWVGEDFDAFAEQMEAVFANCEQISEDIGDGTTGLSGLLNQKKDEIYALQGGDSGELPYPAPQFWTEDELSLFSDGKIHVRAPFTDGDCDIAEGCSLAGTATASEAMELGGFDSDYADELNQYQADQTEYHYARLQAENPEATEAELAELRTQAEDLATRDANDRAAQDYEQSDQDYRARATEQNETVTARWEDAETSTSEFTPGVEASQDTVFQESADDLDTSGYSGVDSASYNSSPTGSGTTGLNSPETTTSFGTTSGGSSGLDSNSSSTPTSEDDEVSGGLASAGTGTLTSTATGSGTGLGSTSGTSAGGVGAGSGLFGSTGGTGPGAGSRTPGTAGGKGSALSGKSAGSTGNRTSSMTSTGGRGGKGIDDEDTEGKETWLTEDEDVWGTYYNTETDPYV